MQISELPLPADAIRLFIEGGFTELYPPQEAAIRAGALEGKSLLLATPTASGKTLISMMCACKQILEQDGHVLYISPLRALSQEKYKQFTALTSLRKPNGEPVSVAISTGDYDSAPKRLSYVDVLITTNEKADSLLRHKHQLFDRLTLIVLDEVHFCGESGRGPTLEIMATKLRRRLPNAQFLALSATVGTVTPMARWLNATPVISEWRPTKLVKGVCHTGKVNFSDGSVWNLEGRRGDDAVAAAIHTVKEGGQSIIFATTKKQAISKALHAGEMLARFHLITNSEQAQLNVLASKIVKSDDTHLAEEEGKMLRQGVAFHHAGLSAQVRSAIEDAFRNRLLKIIASTPTLAAGIDLPARTVVIASVYRYDREQGNVMISPMEIAQMSGRAGRPKYDKVGYSVIVASSGELAEELEEMYITRDPNSFKLESKLETRGMPSHVLGLLASDEAYDVASLLKFFEKTLYAQINGKEWLPQLEPRITQALDYLIEAQMVTIQSGRYKATAFGRLVSELYIEPETGVVLRTLCETGTPDPVAALAAICRTPDMPPISVPRAHSDAVNAFYDEHVGALYSYVGSPDAVYGALMLNMWLNERTYKEMEEYAGAEPGVIYAYVSSAEWLLHAARRISQTLHSPPEQVRLSGSLSCASPMVFERSCCR